MCLSYRNSSVSHCMIYSQEMQNDALFKTHDLKILRFLARECGVKKSKLSRKAGSHFVFFLSLLFKCRIQQRTVL